MGHRSEIELHVGISEYKDKKRAAVNMFLSPLFCQIKEQAVAHTITIIKSLV